MFHLSVPARLLQDEAADQVGRLVQRYLTTNKVSSLSPSVAGALGQLLCGLTAAQWESLVTASVFPSLVTDHLAALQCSLGPESARHLAGHLHRLYGSTVSWNVSDVASVGRLVTSLPSDQLSAIPPHAMEGLAPLAVKWLSPAQWSSLSPEQLSFLSPHSASFISTDLLHSISSSSSKMREIRATVGEDSKVTKELEMMFSEDLEPDNSRANDIQSPSLLIMINLLQIFLVYF